MVRRKVLALLITFVLIFVAGCSLQGNAKGPKIGKYILQDTEVEGWAWVLLKSDNQFEFNRWGATSYLPMGTYSTEDNILTLQVSVNEVYKFEVDGENLIFQGGNIPKDWIFGEGAIFKLAEDR